MGRRGDVYRLDGRARSAARANLRAAVLCFFFSSRRRHTRLQGDWSSDVCSSDLRDFHNHKLPFKWPYRGHGKPGKYGKLPQGMEWKINEWTENLFTIPQDDPYALAPGAKFTWTRLRAVGGRTLVWGRESGRFGPLDFKPKSLQDGFGEDWPITYDALAPHYDHVDTLIGMAGGAGTG